MDLDNTDVLLLLADLHIQATRERSHHYTGKVITLAIAEITALRTALVDLRSANEQQLTNVGTPRPIAQPREIKEDGLLRIFANRCVIH